MIVNPVDAREGQHFITEAFRALEAGPLNNVVAEVERWANQQCYKFLQAYPGERRDNLKDRYFDKALEEIKAGWLLPGRETQVVRVVEDYVVSRFAETI